MKRKRNSPSAYRKIIEEVTLVIVHITEHSLLDDCLKCECYRMKLHSDDDGPVNSTQPWRLRSSCINMVHFFSCSSPPLTLSICPPPNILSKKHPPLRTAVLAASLKDMAQKDIIFHRLVHLVGCISYILEQYAMLCFYREELGLSHSQSGFYIQLTAFHYTEHFLSQHLVPCLLFIHTFWKRRVKLA